MKPLLALLRVELLLSFRRGESVLITLVVPVVLLVFFGAVAPPPAIGIDHPTDFLVPGLLGLAVMSTSLVSLGIATAYERYYGVLKRLIGSPLPRSSMLAAKTMGVMAVEILQAAVLLLIAHFLFGWAPSGSPLEAIAALLLGSVAFAGIGLFLAGTLRAEATLAIANGLYLLFLLLGGFVFPIDNLPGGLSVIARGLPAAALSDATRGALSSTGATSFAPFLLLAVWAVIASAAAALTFKAE